MVDDQCEAYTAELLVKMKDDHENWVKEKLTGTPEVKSIRCKRIRENALPCLGRLTSGKDVLNIVDGANGEEKRCQVLQSNIVRGGFPLRGTSVTSRILRVRLSRDELGQCLPGYWPRGFDNQ